MRSTRVGSGALALTVALAGVVAAFGAIPLRTTPASARAQVGRGVTTASVLIGAGHSLSLPAGQFRVCGEPALPGRAECTAVSGRVSRGPARAGGTTSGSAGTIPGYGPAILRQAYQLTKASLQGGQGVTVAIVDAYGDPSAASDLAAYRSHYKLPACTLASHCLRIVNENGAATPLPAASTSWAQDQSINLDMVSAICPNCRILLVQASSNSLTDLGTAEDSAVTLGAKFVANSWGDLQFLGETSYEHYFDHPGAAIVFASGTGGYQTFFPAASPYVTAVGGTTLRRSRFNVRRWAETAWAGAGSGCSIFEAKPSWQRSDAKSPAGCLNRTVNDVAAVADPATGVAVYDSYRTSHRWSELGGTGAAAAIITAVYALAGTPAPHTYPAAYPYRKAGHLFDVIAGGSETCPFARIYLCQAVKGYDGPTGLGTPDGVTAFAAPKDLVTVLDPGTQDRLAGSALSLRLHGLDARRGAATLSYSATGLPAGTSITSAPGSTDGLITGTLPGSAGSYHVTVTARDTTTGVSGVTHFAIVGAGSLTPSAPITSMISLFTFEGQCLDGGNGTVGTVVELQSCSGVQEQLWSYVPDGAPGDPGTLNVEGNCLALVGNSPQLAACTPGASDEAWTFSTGGQFENPSSGTCLGTPSTPSTTIAPVTCDPTSGRDSWYLDAATIQSALPGMCVATSDDGFHSSPVMIGTCRSFDDQNLWIDINARIESSLDRCVGSGQGVQIGSCTGAFGQDWLVGPNGELINEGSGLCLDDPGDSTVSGTQLTESDCYGQLGQIWAYS